MIEREDIDRLLEAADPRRVAEALGLRAGAQGRRFFCPACQDDGRPHRTPDLSVGRKGFHCFKCGEKGDLLKLVQRVAELDFPGAVAWMQDFTGIRPPGGHSRKRGSYDARRREKSHPGASLQAPPRAEAPEKPKPAPEVFSAFLEACRPVEGPALRWLTETRGVSPDVVNALGLRFCGREYADVIDGLRDRFGDPALIAAGLLRPSRKTGRPVGSFWHYYASKAGFLVIPYFRDGRPVYLKARPPMSKAEAERRELVRFLNTAAEVPCLYNVDALKNTPKKALLCEGESDTWAALSYPDASGRFPAIVGHPGAELFKPEWAALFKGFTDEAGRSTVFLALDADDTGAADRGALKIARYFERAGLPRPRVLKIPQGMDFSDYYLSQTSSDREKGGAME